MGVLLLATIPDLSSPHFLFNAISSAAANARNTLRIVLFSRHFNAHPQPPAPWQAVQRILTYTYVHATKSAYDLDNILLEIDVLLKGFDTDLDPSIAHGIDIVYRVAGDSIAAQLPESIATLRTSYLPAGERHSDSQVHTAASTPVPAESFPVVALGGTFDHLHGGHKILLSMGAWIADRKLIVGTTEDALLQNKANRHVLEPLSTRIESVRAFLTLFKPSISYDIVPIHDVYGPTGWDADIQALVVSKETLAGADAIANYRTMKRLPALQTFIIDVISTTNADLDHQDATWLREHKLSSTFIRQWIADKQRKEKEDRRSRLSSTSSTPVPVPGHPPPSATAPGPA